MRIRAHVLAGLGTLVLTVGLMAGGDASASASGPPAQPPDQHGGHPPVAATRAAPADPVPAGFADWSAVYDFQARLNAAAERIVAADPAGRASIVAAPTNGELRVYWPGQVPQSMRLMADRLDVPVSFQPARFGHNALVEEARQLAADPRVAQAAPQANGSGVAVTVTASEGLSARTALQAGTSVPISVTVGERPRPMFGRQADVPRFYGGSRYDSGSPFAINCTNGFQFRFGDSHRMATAAHCVTPGAAVRIPGQPGSAGTVTTVSGCRDTALIDYPGGTDPRIYTGPAESSTVADVLGATPDFVGNLIATGGATSGEHVNIPVQAVNVFVTRNNSCGTNGDGPYTRAGFSTAKCAVASGDSGGPAYSYVPNANSVLARGTISAGSGTASCPNGGNTGANTVFYAPLFRPANNRQVGSLDFYRAAPPTAMASDISGRWTAEGRSPIIAMKDARLTIDMSAFGRPAATGFVTSGNTIKVTFPDHATQTGVLEGSGTIRWSDGSSWFKAIGFTDIDLQGRWSGGTGPGPFFSATGRNLSVDMSAFGRPTATGTVIDSTTISVTFPDDRTNIGRLELPNVIRWSDGSFWTKL